MKNRISKIAFLFLILVFVNCVVNIFAARYYRLTEQERKVFLGLRGIDSLTAATYLDLESPTERADLYEQFWRQKPAGARTEFESRIEYGFSQFGRYAPLNDDRIPIYVKYGPPTKRDVITPRPKIGLKIEEVVKPAEIWTYKALGTIFDFVRVANAYKVIAQSEFGEKVKIPHLKEIAADTSVNIAGMAPLDFDIAAGRFRQKKNLTRLEIYLTLEITDTTRLEILRTVKLFDKNDSLVTEKKNLLVPEDGAQGLFFDEVNFWLVPEQYRVNVELTDLKNKRTGKKDIAINLLEYQDDAKQISDIVPAFLIDDAFSHEKFNKPVGRSIPLTKTRITVHTPFYFYVEAYNLETENGIHKLRTTYEVYNKTAMRREIVDVMIHDWIEPGDVAYLATEYHPMDLNPGNYIMVVRVQDLISNEERAAVTEFELVLPD